VFVVDATTGEQSLLVSFRELQERLREESFKGEEHLGETELFINHTLWSRDDSTIYFYCRGDFPGPGWIDVPFTMKADGSELTIQRHVGGHVEWDADLRILNPKGERYDIVRREVVERIAGFSDEDGDVALSPDGRRIAKGSSRGRVNQYVIVDRTSGDVVTSEEFSRGPWRDALRVDGAPLWNRTSDKVLFAAVVGEDPPTQQLFVVELN
jgi:hypothetical protein